jgi:hypothetical protein
MIGTVGWRRSARAALAVLAGMGLGAMAGCSSHPAPAPPDIGLRDTGPRDAMPDFGSRMDGGACPAPLDLVLSVDVSTSMTSTLMGQVRDAIPTLWTTAHALSESPAVYLVVFVDDVMAANGSGAYPGDGMCVAFSSPDDMLSHLDQWRALGAMNQDPVSHQQNHDCAENSLDAIVAAASACPFREQSSRYVVHFTDDTFAERPTVLSGQTQRGVQVQHTYAETLAVLANQEVRFSAFSLSGAGPDCGAGVRSPNVGQGFSEGFAMMPSLPDATGGQWWSLADVRGGSLDVAMAVGGLLGSTYCR